ADDVRVKQTPTADDTERIEPPPAAGQEAASGDAAAEGQGLPATGARAQRVNVRPARRQSERWSTVFTVFAAIALAALLLLGAAIVGARQTVCRGASRADRYRDVMRAGQEGDAVTCLEARRRWARTSASPSRAARCS